MAQIQRTVAFDDHYPAESTGASWCDSELVCALADNQRHLGHVIWQVQWHAYDATHSDNTSHGFKYLGAFAELAVAKRAVEAAVGRKPAVRSAGGYGFN